MSYRNIMFEVKKVSRKKNHKWRKFQRSKKPLYIATNEKGKVIAASDSQEDFLSQLDPKRKRKR